MRLVEFKERYPKYSLGFLADNEETETEKLAQIIRLISLFLYQEKTIKRCLNAFTNVSQAML